MKLFLLLLSLSLSHNTLALKKDISNNGEGSIKPFSIVKTDYGIKATISNSLIFHYKTPSLTKSGKSIITTLLAKIPPNASASISVIGHSDSTAIKDTDKFRYPSNWELSASRAASVVRYINSTKNKKLKSIMLIGMADLKPIAPNFTTAGRALNRRIELIIKYSKSTIQKENQKLNAMIKSIPKTCQPLIEDYAYASMPSCTNIEKEYIHTYYFEDSNASISENDALIKTISDYILHRGRILSIIIESHSSSKENILKDDSLSRIRANSIKAALIKNLNKNVIKTIAYGDKIKFKTDSDILNNRLVISVLRCNDRYKPQF